MRTESIDSMRFTEKWRPTSRSISIQFSVVSHSALSMVMASRGPSPKLRKRENTLKMPRLLDWISSTVRMRRVSSRPDGSPTIVVPPPISAIALFPVCWSQCSIMICTSEPTCKEGAVQSKPIYPTALPSRASASSPDMSEHWWMKPRSCRTARKSDVGLKSVMAGRFIVGRCIAENHCCETG